MNFLEKLDFLMKRYGLNKNTLSQKSDIPYTTIDGWYKKGYEGLKITTLKKLSDYFNTTLDYWILDEITDPNYGKSSGFKVDYDEMEHVKQYRLLDDFGKETIQLAIKRELQRSELIASQKDRITELENNRLNVVEFSNNTSRTKILSYYGKIASAGKGVEFSDILSGSTMLECPTTDENRCADYAIGVSGDSMEPSYYDGDIVFVKKTYSLNVGEVGIFQKDNEILIKEVGDNELLSHNKKYAPIKNNGDIVCLGKVIGKVCC